MATHVQPHGRSSTGEQHDPGDRAFEFRCAEARLGVATRRPGDPWMFFPWRPGKPRPLFTVAGAVEDRHGPAFLLSRHHTDCASAPRGPVLTEELDTTHHETTGRVDEVVRAWCTPSVWMHGMPRFGATRSDTAKTDTSPR